MADYNDILAQALLRPGRVDPMYAAENRQRLAAQLLVKQASDTSTPVYSPGLGYAKLGAALLGGLMVGNEDYQDAQANTDAKQKLGIVPPPTSSPPSDIPPPPNSSDGAAPAQSPADVPPSPAVAKAQNAATSDATSPPVAPQPSRNDYLAIAANERVSPLLRKYALEQSTPDVQYIKADDGSIVAVDKRTQAARPIYKGEKESSTNYAIKEGPDGTVYAINPKNPSDIRPIIKAPPAAPPANPYTTPGVGGKPLTESQANAGNYGTRMAEAHKTINELEAVGTDPAESAKAALPGVVGNWAMSPDRQRLEQAKRDFVTATLRRESGAAISKSEFDTAEKQYFPQVGDSPEVLAAKRRNRETTTTGVMAGAGPNYKPPESFKPGDSGGWRDLGNGVRIREKQ